MKKNFKLVLALVLAAMMIASMIPAMADGYDPQIRITGLAEGDVVHLYKVVQWVGDAAGNVSGWAATSDYANVLTTSELSTVLGVTGNNPGISATMAGNLARVNSTEVNTATVPSGGVYSYTVGGPGIYMALITPHDPNTVYNPVFVSSDYKLNNDTSEWAVTENSTYTSDAAAKKGTTTLTKEANTTEDRWDDSTDANLTVGQTGKLHWTTTAIGDTVSYTVTTTIPGYGNVYQNPTFVLRDELEHLTLKGKPTITSPSLTEGTDYEVSGGAGDKVYTITFKPDYLKKVTTPTTVTVTYQATVDTSAPLNINPQTNEVSTKFSHTPTSEDDYNFKKDTTQHYTFSLDAEGIYHDIRTSGEKGSEILKVGQNADGTPVTSESYWTKICTSEEIEGPLQGATFGLYVLKAGATIGAGGKPTADQLEEYKPNGSTDQLTAITTSEGRMTFSGLDAGTYYLMEKEAPTGFVKSTEIVPIVIEAYVTKKNITEWTSDGVTWVPNSATGLKPFTYETEILTSYSVTVNGNKTTHVFKNDGVSNDITWSEHESEEIPTSIPNVKGVELPHTGGIGTTIFYVGGSLLVLAAAILLITKRRMGSND